MEDANDVEKNLIIFEISNKFKLLKEQTINYLLKSLNIASNLFTVSKYFNIENEEFNENEYLNLKEERDESSEESSSEMKDEDTEKFKEPKNDNNKIIFDIIKEKKDFSFNLEQCVNSIDLNVSKLELNKDINDNLKFK